MKIIAWPYIIFVKINKKKQGRKKKKALGVERCTEKELGWGSAASRVWRVRSTTMKLDNDRAGGSSDNKVTP